MLNCIPLFLRFHTHVVILYCSPVIEIQANMRDNTVFTAVLPSRNKRPKAAKPNSLGTNETLTRLHPNSVYQYKTLILYRKRDTLSVYSHSNTFHQAHQYPYAEPIVWHPSSYYWGQISGCGVMHIPHGSYRGNPTGLHSKYCSLHTDASSRLQCSEQRHSPVVIRQRIDPASDPTAPIICKHLQ